jgi:hypothetical protein
MDREPRIKSPKKECCTMKTLTLLILVTMLVQLFIMVIPVYLGTSFYINNRVELEYSKNLHVKQVIDRVNDIGDLPILTIAGDVLNSTSTAKQSVGTAVEILNRMNIISKQVKEDIKIIKNIRALTTSLVKPIEEVTDLLNDKNRRMVHEIVAKINKMLKTLTDDEINQVLTKITTVAGSAEKFLSPENRNMTNHVLQDSDVALARLNKILGKFN